MATATILPQPRFVAYDPATGDPLVGGLVHTYVPGGTVPATTWQDAGETTPNSNPIVLDSDGSCLLYGSGPYQLTTTDALGNAVPGYSGLSADLISTIGGTISPAMAPIVAASTVAIARTDLGVISPGQVVMFRSPYNASWQVVTETGAALNISGTTTQGLQEAINYAALNGVPFICFGGGITTPAGGGADNASITCTTTLNIPTCNANTYEFYGLTLFLSPTIATDDGMVFDTVDMLNFKFRGQIVYAGSGSAVHLLPVNDNGETFVGATSSLFDIATIVCADISTHLPQNAEGICLRVSAANGHIINNRFWIGECNAGLVGVQIDDPSGSFTARLNEFDMPAVHGQGSAAISVGTTPSTNQIYGNIWRATVTPTGVSSIGFDTWAQADLIQLSIGGGAQGINLNGSAARNSFMIIYNGAGIPVVDGSTTADNAGIYGDWYPAAEANLNGSNQTGIANATPTKVLFLAGDYNNATAFSNTTSRWTPGRQGIAHISARVGWNTLADGTLTRTMIYKNGSIVRSSATQAGGADGSGVQGAMISADCLVSATSDYFEIWTEQASGGNLDASGDVTLTWATFRMVRS